MSNDESAFIKIKHTQPGKTNENFLNPSIVVFPENHPKEEDLYNNEGMDNWVLCENKNEARKEDKMLIGQYDKIIFEAKSRKNSQNKSNYMIGVFSKKKRILNFIDIESIFTMRQKIRKIEEMDKEEKNKKSINSLTSVGQTQQENYYEKKFTLVDSFGTLKAKKQMEQVKTSIRKEKHNDTIESLAKVIEENSKGTDEATAHNEESQFTAKFEKMKEILPEFDLNATESKKIYNIQSIISDEKLSMLNHKPILKQLKKVQLLEASKRQYPDLIYNCLLKLEEALKEQINISKRIKYCMFLDYLVKFYHLPEVIKKTPEEISTSTGIDNTFINDLVKTYTQEALYLDTNLKYVKTPQLNIKLTCHIIILSLFLYDFSMDGKLLLSALNIQPKILHDIMKEVGCSFPDEIVEKVGARKVKNIKDFTIELKAPLKLNFLEVPGKFKHKR